MSAATPSRARERRMPAEQQREEQSAEQGDRRLVAPGRGHDLGPQLGPVERGRLTRTLDEGRVGAQELRRDVRRQGAAGRRRARRPEDQAQAAGPGLRPVQLAQQPGVEGRQPVVREADLDRERAHPVPERGLLDRALHAERQRDDGRDRGVGQEGSRPPQAGSRPRLHRTTVAAGRRRRDEDGVAPRWSRPRPTTRVEGERRTTVATPSPVASSWWVPRRRSRAERSPDEHGS